jgi:hypothetical protein
MVYIELRNPVTPEQMENGVLYFWPRQNDNFLMAFDFDPESLARTKMSGRVFDIMPGSRSKVIKEHRIQKRQKRRMRLPLSIISRRRSPEGTRPGFSIHYTA